MSDTIFVNSGGMHLQPLETPFGMALLPTTKVVVTEEIVNVETPKIPLADWKRIVSFLLWSQEEYGQEALVHGFFNPTPKKGEPNWIIEPPNQEPHGLNVKQATTGEEAEQNRKRYAELEAAGYILRFTAHHHCKIAAGQSGTDRDDEHSKPSGFHITLGNLDQETMSFHSRLVLRRPAVFNDKKEIVIKAGTIQLNPPPSKFIETPLDKIIDDLPWLDVKSIDKFFLQKHKVEFPEAWKSAIEVAETRFCEGFEANHAMVIKRFLSAKGHVAEMFNKMLKFSAQERSEAFRGSDVPQIDLPWRKVKTKKRRAVYDALHHVINFYIHSFYKEGQSFTVDEILEAYVKNAAEKKHVTYHGGSPTFAGYPGMQSLPSHYGKNTSTTVAPTNMPRGSVHSMTDEQYHAWENERFGVAGG